MLDLRPLRSAGFRHLATGYLVNEFGNWIGEITLTVLVFDRTHSALGTAALFLALRFAPALFAPLLTTRVETLTPRLILPVLYGLEASLFACIALVARNFSLPIVLALSMADGALAVTAKALTRSATASGLVRDGLLREGNAIMNLGVMAASACSPLIAGGLVAWQGPQAALLADAGTFLVTAVIISSARNIRVESDLESTFRERLRKGGAVVRRRASVRRLMVALAFVMFLSAIPLPIEVVFAKRTLHAGDFGYGLMLASWGAGMVIGGAAFAWVTEARLIRIVAIGTLLNAVAYGGLAAAPTLLMACVASVVGGIGNGSGWIAAVTALQERIPLNTQSSVMSVLEGLNQLMPALGFVLGGALTAASSPRVAYGVAAAGVALVVLTATAKPIDQVVMHDGPATDLCDAQEAAQCEAQETEKIERKPQLPTLTIG